MRATAGSTIFNSFACDILQQMQQVVMTTSFLVLMGTVFPRSINVMVDVIVMIWAMRPAVKQILCVPRICSNVKIR